MSKVVDALGLRFNKRGATAVTCLALGVAACGGTQAKSPNMAPAPAAHPTTAASKSSKIAVIHNVQKVNGDEVIKTGTLYTDHVSLRLSIDGKPLFGETARCDGDEPDLNTYSLASGVETKITTHGSAQGMCTSDGKFSQAAIKSIEQSFPQIG